MLKLTETTNDLLRPGWNGGAPTHVIPPHEPLTGEVFTPQVNVFTKPLPPTQPDALKVYPWSTKSPLKIAIIGTAPSSRMLAPYNDPTWTIWACSPGNMNTIPRHDAWFEIHGSLLWPENRHYGEPYIQFLSGLKCPVFMQDNRYCPNAIHLPKDELVKEFGPYYFTSSFAWMMAMAIREGAKEIALYGVDMASRDEYILQRPGAYHFFNEARKRGIKITAPYESDILQPPGLYGYSEVTPFGRKLIARTQELKERLAGLRQQRESINQNITYLEGALEDVDYISSIWGGVQNNSGLDIENRVKGDSDG